MPCQLVFFWLNPADIAVFAAIYHIEFVGGGVFEHQRDFIVEIHIHHSFRHRANGNIGFQLGNGERSIVNVDFFGVFVERKDGFVGNFGKAGTAFVVVELGFVTTQTSGDVLVGGIKCRVRIAGGAGAFLNNVFGRMNRHIGGKVIFDFGKDNAATDRRRKIFVNGVHNVFFHMVAESVSNINLISG